MEQDRLADLIADGHDRIQRGHRLLEDHRDLDAADRAVHDVEIGAQIAHVEQYVADTRSALAGENRFRHMFARGSRASRRPSPMKLMPRTIRTIAMPGKNAHHQLPWLMNSSDPVRMLPRVGVAVSTPNPRKLTNASLMITPATPSVVATMIGESALGTRWRKMIRMSLTPAARAAST